jgi:hypothetical protein
MARNLALALLVIAALVGALVLVASRTERGASGGEGTAAGPGERDGGEGAARRALGALQQIAEMSQQLMPPGYERVYVSMPLDELRRARPAVHRDTSAPARPDGLEVWEEDDPSGARVIYLVSARARLVTQVQFASRLGDPQEVRGHFDAMQGRYGQPTGIWDCPETPEASPMRRFTWRREGASVMEAVLIYGSTVALTLVVAPNDDIARALSRSQCKPVRSPEALRNFPVADVLRGEQTPFLREVPRDR